MTTNPPAWVDGLLALVDAGHTVAEAARRCGVDYNAAYHQVRRRRGRQAKAPDPEERARLHARLARGDSVRAAAAALGIPKSRAYRLAEGAERSWQPGHDPELKAYAVALIAGSETVAAVAERLALPDTTVGQWARAAGRRTRQVLDAETRRVFAEALASGASVPDAARRAGIGVTTAYRLAEDSETPSVRRMTVRALPVRKWPAALAAGADGLAREERLALGRLCHARALTAVPAIADVEAFLAQRAGALTPPVAERERKVLVSALRKAVPSTAWSQLRAAETDATGQPERRGKPRSVSLSPAEWPAPQRAAWEAARDPGYLDAGDVVAYEPGPLAGLSQSTLAAREKAYGLYLGSRRSRGKPLTVTPVGVQVFIDDCQARGNRPRSIAKYISDLYPIARTVHPAVDFDWLRRTCNSLRARAAEAPKKKWDAPPADPAALWAIGCDLIDRAHAGAADSRRNAALFRDGVLFLLLSSAPVRLENLAEIAISTHLILSPEGPGYLTFDRTKAGHAAELPLWPELRAALEVYLDVYRPVLLAGQPTDALWIGLQGGEPLCACGVADRIREHTEAYLGRPLSPHRFRDAVANAIVVEHPDAPDLASAMLQHRNPRSIAEYTEQGRTVGAARLLAELSRRAYGEAQRALRGG